MNQLSPLRSALPLLLFVILAGSAAWACFGERGILANESLRAELAARHHAVEERERTITHLHLEIERMKSDERVQERWVREELGYVRPGEIVYLFPGDRNLDLELLRDRRLSAPLRPKDGPPERRP